MGSEESRPKEYNRYNCFNCSPCNSRGYYSCDNCSCSCCVDCMSSHRGLFNLNDDFNSQLRSAENDLCNKSSEIKSNLYRRYDIYIYADSFNYTYECKNFLNSMRDKKNEFENKLNNSEIPSIEQNYRNTVYRLNREHEEKLNRLRNDFNERKQQYSFTQDKNLERKTEERDRLQNDKNKIKNDKDTIIKNYENEKRSKEEAEFKKKTNVIDQKYSYNEEKLEYTQDELKMKQQYLDEIHKIKPYTKNPLFCNLISQAGLFKYIS